MDIAARAADSCDRIEVPILESMVRAFRSARLIAAPFPHYIAASVLPESAVSALVRLPFDAPDLNGRSGKRERNDHTRVYFDEANMAQFPIMKEVAEALHSARAAGSIAEYFGADVEGSFLRIEYALDAEGFWLEPHTDLSVKKLTCQIQLNDGRDAFDLGTDLYSPNGVHCGRMPFQRNGAAIFVPSDSSWHGFEKRAFLGVRRSLIVTYVAAQWRARDQLSFPNSPVQTRARPRAATKSR